MGVELLAQTFTFTLLPARGLSMLKPGSQQPCKADGVQFPFYRRRKPVSKYHLHAKHLQTYISCQHVSPELRLEYPAATAHA